MTRTLFAVVLAAILSTPAIGQSEQAPQSTTAPTGSRYEIVQSELAAKWTFRLDKRCGNVSQLVSVKGETSVSWQQTPVVGLPPCSATAGAKYQIFTSGLAARHTFLIDTVTGRSWILAEDDEGNAFWKPFAI